MTEKPDLKNATPEQMKEINKVLFKSLLSFGWIMVKFSVGLFVMSLASMLIGFSILKDVDPEMRVGFQIFSTIVNFIFMMTFLDRRVRANSDIVNNKIKEILKSKSEN
jgi:hypothetical protein